MKIAVSAMGPSLDAEVDPRLGRCQYLIFVDTDTMNYEALQNPYISAMGGAGIQTAQLIAEKGAKVVLTGHAGPNAFQALSSAGIQVITAGTVREAVERWRRGELSPSFGPTAPSHFGMGGGMGRGMGGGMGRGMGMGGGFGPMPPPMPFQMPPMPEPLEGLREELESINRKLDEILRRLEGLR